MLKLQIVEEAIIEKPVPSLYLVVDVPNRPRTVQALPKTPCKVDTVNMYELISSSCVRLSFYLEVLRNGFSRECLQNNSQLNYGINLHECKRVYFTGP
jgi:hypothetical protein